MNLQESLSRVKDPRRLQGQRYSSISMLLIIIMGMLRGKYGYRELGRFCKLNSPDLIEIFNFKCRKVPSHVSIRTFIQGLDFISLQDAFYQWAREYVHIEEGEWIGIDGKSIRSTVSDSQTALQNFVSLVSLFCRKREQVLHAGRFENKTGNEVDTVNSLLDILDLKGVTFTMDALHCKKNAGQNRKSKMSLPG